MNFYETTRTTIRNNTTNCTEDKHPKTTKSHSTMNHLPISGERKTLCSWIFTICLVTTYSIILYYDIQSLSEIEHNGVICDHDSFEMQSILDNAALTYPTELSVPTNDWIEVQWDLPIESWTGQDDAIWELESPGSRSLLADGGTAAPPPDLQFSRCTGQMLYEEMQQQKRQHIRKIEFTVLLEKGHRWRTTLNFDGWDVPSLRTFVSGSIRRTDVDISSRILSFDSTPLNHQIAFYYSKEKPEARTGKELLNLPKIWTISDVGIYRGASIWTMKRLLDEMQLTTRNTIRTVKFTVHVPGKPTREFELEFNATGFFSESDFSKGSIKIGTRTKAIMSTFKLLPNDHFGAFIYSAKSGIVLYKDNILNKSSEITGVQVTRSEHLPTATPSKTPAPEAGIWILYPHAPSTTKIPSCTIERLLQEMQLPDVQIGKIVFTMSLEGTMKFEEVITLEFNGKGPPSATTFTKGSMQSSKAGQSGQLTNFKLDPSKARFAFQYSRGKDIIKLPLKMQITDVEITRREKHPSRSVEEAAARRTETEGNSQLPNPPAQTQNAVPRRGIIIRFCGNANIATVKTVFKMRATLAIDEDRIPRKSDLWNMNADAMTERIFQLKDAATEIHGHMPLDQIIRIIKATLSDFTPGILENPSEYSKPDVFNTEKDQSKCTFAKMTFSQPADMVYKKPNPGPDYKKLREKERL